ncbi:MAG TPA: hypothetical protein VJY33_01775 [Isosphaeraceae bacterium]|nr:hypothetical protein [Isosphaeraceae bacterium]
MPTRSLGRTRFRTGLKLAFLGLVLGRMPCSGMAIDDPLHVSVAPSASLSPPNLKSTADENARQVTLFAIRAIPGSKELDPRLETVQGQLRKALPGYGFRLLDVESKRIEASQSVTCNLGNGTKAEVILVRPFDENGKVQLRCSVFQEGTRRFSALFKTPANQLFFYEQSLGDGTRVLIGVGARDAMKIDGSHGTTRSAKS